VGLAVAAVTTDDLVVVAIFSTPSFPAQGCKKLQQGQEIDAPNKKKIAGN